MESTRNFNRSADSGHTRRHSSFLLRLTGWVLALLIIGTVACIVLGTLRLAVQVSMIAGCVCLVLALFCALGYRKIKAKIRERDD